MIMQSCIWIDNAPWLVFVAGWVFVSLAFIAGLLMGLRCVEVKDK